MNILDTLLIFKGDAKPALEQMALMREGLSKVQDAHEKTKSSLMGGIVKAGVFAVGAVAVGAFFEALHSGVEAYSAAEVATGKLDTTLKDQGVSLAANRDEVEKTQASMRGLGHTNAQTTDSVTTLVQAHVPLAEALKDQTTLADLAAEKFGGDLQAATDAVAKGANGRLNPALKEMGVHLKKGETGAAAMADILAQTSKQVDGQAATYSHTLPGALAVMKASWDNIAESIGKRVVPYIERFAGWVTDHQAQITGFVTGVLDAMGAAFDIIGTAVGFVSDHLNIIAPILATVLLLFAGYEIVGVISALWTAYNLVLAGASVAEALAAVGATGLGLAIDFMLGPVGLAILAIAAVIAIGYLLITHWSQVKDVASAVGAAVKNFFVDAFHKVTEAIGDAIDWVKQHWPLILAILTGPIGLAVYAIATHWQQIKDGVSNFVSAVIQFFKDLPGKIWTELLHIVEKLIDLDVQMVSWVEGKLADFFTSVLQFFKDLPGNVWTELIHIKEKLVDLDVEMVSWVRDKLSSFIDSVVQFFRDLPGKIWGEITHIVDKLEQWREDAHNWVFTHVPQLIDDVVGFFRDLPGKITGALGNLGSLLLNAGGQIIAGLLKGITDKFAEVKNFVGGIASSIASLKGPLDYDRRLLVPHGNAIMDGLGEGLASGFGRVQDQVSGMALNLASSVGPISGGAGPGGGSGVTINQTVNLAAGMDPSQIVPQMKTANDNLLAALQQQLVVR